jgi:ABC-type cobalamin transport system permease subunit
MCHFWRKNMKKLVLAAALTAAASTAFAGAPAFPFIEAPVMIEETGSSSSGILLPLILLAIVAAAVSN